MEFFISIIVIGAVIILLAKSMGKQSIINNDYCEKTDLLSKFVDSIEEYILMKLKVYDGVLLCICGIVGATMYNTIGLLMVAVAILLFIYTGIKVATR